jgi:thioredoxin-dependent peroxiredoxin
MSFRRPLGLLTTLGLAAATIGSRAAAQQPQSAASSTAPDVGQLAPDFTLPGASRYGLLRDPFHLADHRGETVVLAFFPKARTKG